MVLDINNWKILLRQGFELKSSGSTGESKTIFQSPAKLVAANRVALDCQQITRQSRILTVCSMNHAGGLLAQTLPALEIGAFVQIQAFNAYSFWKDVRGFSHTHLTPAHCELLVKTKTFSDIDLTGLFVTCGSDEVSFDIVDAFVRRGAIFMCNWGMTEIGPIVINTVFNSVEQVDEYRRKAITEGSLMGDRYYCDYEVRAGCLYVKGPTCVYDSWFKTMDRVEKNQADAMYFMGRAV